MDETARVDYVTLTPTESEDPFLPNYCSVRKMERRPSVCHRYPAVSHLPSWWLPGARQTRVGLHMHNTFEE